MVEPSNLFYSLTPDVILACIEKLGYEPTGRYIPLNSIENRVYDIELTSNIRIVAKFYRPNRWSLNQIKEEHSFLIELAEAEIPVLVPIDVGGTTVFENLGLYYAIWPLRTGRIVEELNTNDLERIGAMLGRIHSVGKRKKAEFRSTLDSSTYGKKALNLILEGDWIKNKSLEKRYKESALRSFEIYDELVKKYHIEIQRIHGDCHKGNLLISKDGYSILDFDDFMMGPAVQDFWMLLPVNERGITESWGSFLEGYRTFSNFEESWTELIEPLRAIRYIHYASWIAKRWSDPSFPIIFPHFGTEEYWLKETSDLENKERDFIKDEPLQQIEDESEELSNKDFFWDWDN